MTTETNTDADERIERLDIALDLIDPDPENRSARLDEAFVKSIGQHGVLSPVLVTPSDDGRYRLVAGERRYLASVQTGKTTIPATVRTADEVTAAVWQAVENLHRSDLLPSEEARQVARIMSAGMKQKALAAALNRPLGWVRARLALVALPDVVQQATDDGTYEPSDALTFAKYADSPDVIDAVLNDNYRSGSDLDWRLERAALKADAEARHAEIVARCDESGWTTYLGHDPSVEHRGAKRLSDVGVDDDAHGDESCHLVAVSRGYSGDTTVTSWCSDPKRHTAKGASGIKAPARTQPDITDAERAQREQAKATRAANAHRNAFAVAAIAAKLRGRDVTDFVLPVFFDCAGQNALKAAAKLIGIEPVQSEQTGYKDHVGPLREWAAESTANLTRAMLAAAYCLAVENGQWRTTANDALVDGLDRLGYQPDTNPDAEG